MKKILWGLAAILLIGLGYYFFQQRENNPQVKEAKIKKQLMKLRESYALAPGQNMKVIKPPFGKARQGFIKKEMPHVRGRKIGMAFADDGQEIKRPSMSYDGLSVYSIVRVITKLKDYEWEVNIPKPYKFFDEDLVYRDGLSIDEQISEMERLFRDELNYPVKIFFKEVPRKVWVMGGNYNAEKPMKIATNNRGVSGRPNCPFEGFVSLLEDELGVKVYDEVLSHPDTMEYHFDKDYESNIDHNVLQQITEQTGLTFTEVTRPIKILFVERAD